MPLDVFFFPHPTGRGCWILCWNPRLLLHHAPTQNPARAARQWIPPSIPPELLASGSRRVSRQSGSPVDPVEYPPERLASGSRRVSRQSGSPVDPAKYPAEYPLPVDPASRQSGFAQCPKRPMGIWGRSLQDAEEFVVTVVSS